MIYFNLSRCQSVQELSQKLQAFDHALKWEVMENETLGKISEFIENNKCLLVKDKQVAILLDSISAKVRRGNAKDPLISKIKGYVQQLLPSNQEEVNSSLHFFRKTISNVSEQLQSMADWINLMEIPLADLALSDQELAELLLRLEYIDLTDYDFESHDLKVVTDILFKAYFKFKTRNPIALGFIARLCAKQNGQITANGIKNFQIANPAVRGEIAIICAQRTIKIDKYYGAMAIARYIKNFEIEDRGVRVEIASLCAKNSVYQTAEFIKNFEINDAASRAEIARVCAHHNGEDTAEYIEKFEIEDPAARAEIARLCAKQKNGLTPLYFKNFAIADPDIRVEIARLCAQNSGEATAREVNNFGIVDPAILIEIARLCAENSPKGTAKFIKNFGITDQAILTEVAQLCASKDPGALAYFFKNFEIRNPDIRAMIARLCASKEGGALAQSFKNFDIEDPNIRKEIARLCAKQNGLRTAECIKNFVLSNNGDRKEALYQCALSDPQSLFCMSNFSPLPREWIKFPRLIQILQNEDPEESIREELFDEMEEFIELNFPKSCQQKLIKTSKEVRAFPPHAQNVIGLWLLSSLFTMSSQKSDSVEWMIQSGIWRELVLLRDPSLRILLSPGLFELSGDEDKRESWKVFLSSVRGVEGKRGLMLMAIPFFALEKQGVEEKRLIEIATTLVKYQHEKNAQLRSVYHVKNMQHTLMGLLSNDTFSPEVRKCAFEKIFSASNEKILIKNIVAAKGLLRLKDQDWPTSVEDLSFLFHHSLEKIIPMLHCKENVAEKYEEIFGSCRNPDGLLTYAAGLNTIDEPELMECLGNYVVSVLDGTFKEKRYKIDGNPHLAKVVESYPNLLKTWKENLSFDLEDLTSQESSSKAFNPEKWLEIKLIKDRHLGDTKFIFVNRYFDKESDKKQIFQDLLLEYSNLVKKYQEKKRLYKEINKLRRKWENMVVGDDLKIVGQEMTRLTQIYNNLIQQVSLPLLAQLNLERACLNLMQKGQAAEKTILISLLMDIDKALQQETFARSEFTTDVKGLMESLDKELKSKGNAKEGLKIVFTDHPIDLLLCGTDVSGSCQRLDGDPNLNKGLLGYLIDGKNRLLAIKEGNKIIARCILRLLWDGEKPVIYRERFYPDTVPANYQTALNTLAKKIATKLNVPLTNNDVGTPYEKQLEALGGPAPYEYSDGGGGVKKNGCYTIQEANLII